MLNVNVNFNILGIRFIRRHLRTVDRTEDISLYLRSYCEWQGMKKIAKKKQYFSILFTSLDLYSTKNGSNLKVREAVGRSFRNGICNPHRSCAVFQWRLDILKYLVAHEIGHSLGMFHDIPPCTDGIMSSRFRNRRAPLKNWTPCNQIALRNFLRTKKARCLRTN
ncbi:A disintegrin and metalloproteinase with thrombospondin motifs 16-like [Plutella xylostella]|uniref:A disintegrin and metalloproteinase with thrombospondin motifs 16-like n=1 Tax=Plutella xylostella TaxID=51655 RepID=UPI00203273E7|nr:A disintegrin and metalloproteinase with thrombospondin motifs 16-like [Plutella xylostella]